MCLLGVGNSGLVCGLECDFATCEVVCIVILLGWFMIWCFMLLIYSWIDLCWCVLICVMLVWGGLQFDCMVLSFLFTWFGL